MSTGPQVFIVESPAKARTIGKYLGRDFRVIATCGHVRDLPKDRLGVALDSLEPEYEITRHEVVRRIQTEVSRASCVWLATDGDREGEGIAAHLLACLNVPAGVPVRRAVFHEITPAALRHAVEHPRELSASMVDAQNSRRVLDRLVGYQVSPLLWKSLGHRDLSAGRVQSAALRILVDHQDRIDRFAATVLSEARAIFRGPAAVGTFGAEFLPHETAAAVAAAANAPEQPLDESWMRSLATMSWTVGAADDSEDVRHPPPPFITSTLQQEAGTRLRLSSKQVMRAAQSLYEAGHITYMRTDSPVLSVAAQQAALSWIRAEVGENYAHPRQYRSKGAHSQEAHEAIRPTHLELRELPATSGASAPERQIYRLIWLRTIGSQMAPARDAIRTLSIVSSDPSFRGRFVARARKSLFDGFRRLVGPEEVSPCDRLAPVPDVPATERYHRWVQHLQAGVSVDFRSIEVVHQPSFPPRHLTEASFVRALEEAGIGRPSTYEPTFATLHARGYMERTTQLVLEADVRTNTWAPGRPDVETSIARTSRKEMYILRPSVRGRAVAAYLAEAIPDLPNPSYTARMEENLDRIASGEVAWRDVLGEYQRSLLAQIERASGPGNVAAVGAANDAPIARPLPAAARPLGSRTSSFQDSRVLGEHPMYPGWSVRVFASGPYGPFVMACPPQKTRDRALFASIPEGTAPAEVTLSMALGFIQAHQQKKSGSEKGTKRIGKGKAKGKGTETPKARKGRPPAT